VKELRIIKRADNPTPDQIKDFERVIGRNLPTDYKYFLENYNPKTTAEKLTIIANNEYIIYNWLPLSSKEELSLSNTFEWTKDLLLGKYLAFALDAGDWLFVISINDIDDGKVFFCRPDQELGKALTLLANSFTEFINGLQPYQGSQA
jgi:hypothetical protein